MCGIVGFCGDLNAQEVILNGLEKLEYRGYDSSGISIISNNNLKTLKRAGRLENLKNVLNKEPIKGSIGIGHTRWATHGVPSEKNAHPHINVDGSIAVVQNGIIENYLELKEKLISIGYEFISETDTEVIAHLLDYYYNGSLLKAVQSVANDLEGSYTFAAITSKEPDKLVAIRHESPLILAISEKNNFIASDIPSVLKYTKNVIYLDDDEIVVLKNHDYKIYNLELEEIQKPITEIEWDLDVASKGGFPHFMLKEIYEQPKVVKDAIQRKLKNNKIFLDNGSFSKKELNKFNKIYIVGCGTAFHAGEVGKYAFEEFTKIPVYTDIASEFRYYSPFVDDKTLIIFISQSGETADTLQALRESKRKGAKTLAITNVVGSSISREADKVIYCFAGPEISVASTKAYTTQLISLFFLALDFSEKLEIMSSKKINEYIEEMKNLPLKIEKILDAKEKYTKIADEIKSSMAIFYTGRGIDYISAKEGALKLKEISYIYTESLQAGELKHGPIALIEKGTNVFVVATQLNLIEKTISNMQELSARGANIYSIGFIGNKNLEKNSKEVVWVPETYDIFSPILTVIPEQLIAYFTSVQKGNDVDMPRNLAKSVTVE